MTTGAASEAGARAILAARSPLVAQIVLRMFARMASRNFFAVRLKGRPDPDVLARTSLVIYSNHPSWWDGVTFALLTHLLLPTRAVFVPVDADMVERYGFFRRMGTIPVRRGSRSSAREFLAACRLVLARPDAFLFIAGQDRFADPRERPIRLAPGLAAIADATPDATFVPLAIEYLFRDERRPDLFLQFGPPTMVDASSGREARAQTLELALAATMDDLAQAVVARDDASFELLLSGRSGINPMYDVWRRAKAFAKREKFHPGHSVRP